MKITPLSTPGLTNGLTIGSVSMGDDAPKTMAQKIRSLKMTTNATPGRPPAPEPLPIPEAASAQPLNTEDNNEDATKPASEEAQPLSPQFAALAKQRRALQVKERELADREKALAEKSPAQGDVVTKAQLKSNPLGILLDAGVTYEQLTEAVLATQNGYTPEIQSLKDEIRSLKEGLNKTLSDKDQQAEQQALAEMRKEAQKLIFSGDDYAVVREERRIPDVMRLIEKTYREKGEILDVREALGLVEAELLKDRLRIARLKKIQDQLSPAQPVAMPPQQQRQMKTLTNRDTASVPMSRKARALAAFSGTLKK